MDHRDRRQAANACQREWSGGTGGAPPRLPRPGGGGAPGTFASSLAGPPAHVRIAFARRDRVLRFSEGWSVIGSGGAPSSRELLRVARVWRVKAEALVTRGPASKGHRAGALRQLGSRPSTTQA